MTIKTLVCSCGLLFFAGCTPPKPATPPPAVRSESPRSALQIAITVSPAAPRQMDLSVFTLTLTDKNQKPVKDVKVKIELTMPAMAMPENVVTLKQAAAGTWVGAGRFTMPGDWRVTATAAPKNGALATRTFPIQVQ